MRVILLPLTLLFLQAPHVLFADVLEGERSLAAAAGAIHPGSRPDAGGCDELFAGVSAATVNDMTSPGLHAMAQQTPWADLDGNGYPEPLTTQLYNHGGWVFEDRARRLPEIRPNAGPEMLNPPPRALRLTSYAVDLNQDGRIDHVEGQAQGLWVRWGIEGGLGEPELVIRSASNELSHWFVGDFDRDGDLDFLEESRFLFRTWVNDSRTSFTVRAEVQTASYDGRGRVTVGDFDGDGWLDVFALSLGDYSSRLTFLWGTAAGGFVETSTFESGQFPIEPATVDLDDDGVDEIAGPGKGGVTIIRAGSRKPVTTFSAYRDHPTSTTDVFVTVAGAADIDGDGLKDLVIRRGMAMTVFWSAKDTLKNGEALDYESYSFPNAGRLALVDADRDGLADIVPLEPIDRLNFVPGRRDRQLRAPRAQLLNRTSQGVSWNTIESAGDVDGDGLEDLLLGALSKVAAVLLARGDGFVESYRLTGIDAVEPVRVVDVDGDGWLDLVHRDGEHGTTRVRFGLGNGTFSSGEMISGFRLSGVMTSRWGVIAYGHCSEGLCGLRTGTNRSLERFVIARGAEWESAPMLWAFDLTGDGLDEIALWRLWNWEYAWVFHEIKEEARAIGPVRLEGMLPFHDAVTGERLILGRESAGLRAYRFIPTGLDYAGPFWYGGVLGVPAKFMREGREDFAVTKTHNSITRLYTVRNEGHGEITPGPPVDVARSGWGDGFLIHEGESGSPRVLRLSDDMIEIVPLACGDQPFRTSLGLARPIPQETATVHIALPLARDHSHFEVTITDSAGAIVFSKWVPEYFTWTTPPLPAGRSRWKISYIDPLLGKQETWIDLIASSRRRAVGR